MCRLQVLDNGLGVNNGQGLGGGNGLGNMRRRAEKLEGSFEIETPGSGGTLLIWQVPVRL
jgi:signal transduction histidine kinase